MFIKELNKATSSKATGISTADDIRKLNSVLVSLVPSNGTVQNLYRYLNVYFYGKNVRECIQLTI